MREQVKVARRAREDQLMQIAQSVSPNDTAKQMVARALEEMRKDKMTHGYILRSLACAIINYSHESGL